MGVEERGEVTDRGRLLRLPVNREHGRARARRLPVGFQSGDEIVLEFRVSRAGPGHDVVADDQPARFFVPAEVDLDVVDAQSECFDEPVVAGAGAIAVVGADGQGT